MRRLQDRAPRKRKREGLPGGQTSLAVRATCGFGHFCPWRRGSHGAARHLGARAGRPGPGPVLRYGPGGLRGASGACGPAGCPQGLELLVPGQALPGSGPEAAAGGGCAAALVRPDGCGAGTLPPR